MEALGETAVLDKIAALALDLPSQEVGRLVDGAQAGSPCHPECSPFYSFFNGLLNGRNHQPTSLLSPLHNRHFLLRQAIQLVHQPVDPAVGDGDLRFDLFEDVRILFRCLLFVQFQHTFN